MPRARVDLIGISLEGVHGFDHAYLPLTQLPIVLAGPNNSGKSALLRILHWVFTDVDENLISGARTLRAEERALLQPARPRQGLAQRVSLWVQLHHGSSRRAYDNTDGTAVLRLHVGANRFFMSLALPTRSEQRVTTASARRLFDALRAQNEVFYLPVGRDFASGEFSRLLDSLVRVRLESALVQSGQGRGSNAQRAMRRAAESVQREIRKPLGTLWSDLLHDGLVRELVQDGSFPADLSVEDLIVSAREALRLRLVTGASDAHGVEVSEVGAGLQSALVFTAAGLHAHLRSSSEQDSRKIVLLEEPESFLHPALQRSFARMLEESQAPIVATTHSSLVAEDFPRRQTVHLRRHQVFVPADEDELAMAKHEWLKRSAAGEPLFYERLLLVEGAGDAAFFEALRRRISRTSVGVGANRAHVVPVGGKRSFGPWLKLVNGFQRVEPVVRERKLLPAAGPFVDVTLVADGADAVSDVLYALRESGVRLPRGIDTLASVHGSNLAERRHATDLEAINTAMEGVTPRSILLEIDLEYAMLRSAGPRDLDLARRFSGLEAGTPIEVMRRLGSKVENTQDGATVVGSAGSSSRKEDWIRAAIGSSIHANSISQEVYSVLDVWLAPTLVEGTTRDALLSK